MNYYIEVSNGKGCSLVEKNADMVILNTYTEETIDEMETFLDTFNSENVFICVDNACIKKIIRSYSYNNYMIETTITQCSRADFDDEQSTIEVNAHAYGRNVNFYVQTTEGKYRSALGCWILTDDYEGDIAYYDFPEFDFDTIIDAAESYLQDDYSDYNGYVIYSNVNSFDVLERNYMYYNEYTSPYTNKYRLLAKRDSFEEAQKYIDNL